MGRAILSPRQKNWRALEALPRNARRRWDWLTSHEALVSGSPGLRRYAVGNHDGLCGCMWLIQLILVISGLCLLCLLFSDLGWLVCRSFQDHERNSVRHSKTTLFFWDGNHSRATAPTAWMAGYQVRRCYLYELLMAYSKKLAYQPSKSGTIKASRLRCGW